MTHQMTVHHSNALTEQHVYTDRELARAGFSIQQAGRLADPIIGVGSILHQRTAESVAEIVCAELGWDREELLEQALEDTCKRHAEFCCPICFATTVPAAC
jgi:hypothetical protein